jgi:hypothetical protein
LILGQVMPGHAGLAPQWSHDSGGFSGVFLPPPMPTILVMEIADAKPQ